MLMLFTRKGTGSSYYYYILCFRICFTMLYYAFAYAFANISISVEVSLILASLTSPGTKIIIRVARPGLPKSDSFISVVPTSSLSFLPLS